MTPIRIGVIGAGLIWIRAHQHALNVLREAFAPVAFCDVDPARREAAARDFPTAFVTADADALLARADVDAALVLTPIAFNAPLAMQALRAGKHVIMEKPMARSTAEAAELIAAARAAGRRLLVAEQLAYRANEDALAAVLASGEIGEPVLWDCVRHWAADPDPAQGELRFDRTLWRKAADFPLGSMFDGGIHLIATLSKVFGRPESITANGRKLREEYGEYDQVAALLTYPGGLTGLLSYSQCMPPMQSHLHVHGSKGIVVVERDRLIVQRHGEPDRAIDLPREDERMAMWRAFAQAFDDGSEPYYTPERAMQDVAILEAADRSIKTGQRVDL